MVLISPVKVPLLSPERPQRTVLPGSGRITSKPEVNFPIADDSGFGGDERVYQDLSEAAQSRLTSLHNLMIRSLIGL